MINNDKTIINILKTGTIIRAQFSKEVQPFYYIIIQTNDNYRVEFYKAGRRKFNILKKNGDKYNTIYTDLISEDNSIEFDYLITSRVKEFISRELEKAFVDYEQLPY